MRAFAIVLMVLVVGGCARPPGVSDGDGEDATMSGDLAASMEVKVSEDGVRLGLHVTNTTTRTMDLTFPTSQRYDFVVTRASGGEVWRWSEGMSFLQAISRASLAANESWDMEAVWDPGEVTGRLVATGWLTTRDGTVKQSATFELP